MIDWADSCIINGRRRYAAHCTCGSVRYLKAADCRRIEQRKAARGEDTPCFHCSQIAKARQGYQAVTKKRGIPVAIERCRAYRLAHPSSLEISVVKALDLGDIPYEREVYFPGIGLVDFFISGQIAIEVNGDWVHQFHRERDQRKAAAIRQRGIPLFVLGDSDVAQISHILPGILKEASIF